MQWPWSLVSTENHTIFPLMLQCNSYIDCKVFSGLPKFQWPRNLTMKRAITRLSWKNCTSFWKWNSSDSDSLAWLHIIITLIKKHSGTNSTCLHKLVDLNVHTCLLLHTKISCKTILFPPCLRLVSHDC